MSHPLRAIVRICPDLCLNEMFDRLMSVNVLDSLKGDNQVKQATRVYRTMLTGLEGVKVLQGIHPLTRAAGNHFEYLHEAITSFQGCIALD